MRTTGQHPGDRPSPGFPLSTHELCHVTAQSRHSPGTGGAGGACVVAELHLPATIARKLRKRARLAAVEGDVRPDYRLVENPPARTAARRTLPLMGEPMELLRDYIASEKLMVARPTAHLRRLLREGRDAASYPESAARPCHHPNDDALHTVYPRPEHHARLFGHDGYGPAASGNSITHTNGVSQCVVREYARGISNLTCRHKRVI
jgi:hypothetical protein